MASASWQDIRDSKQAHQASLIPKEWLLPASSLPGDNVLNVTDIPRTCGLLDPKELHITEGYDARALAEEIRKGRLRAVDVTTAFCKRAAIAHQLTNCLTEILFREALQRAAYLDSHFAKTGRTLGPLHGLPISLKDSFDIRGVDSSIGIAALAHKPAQSNASLVDLLLDAGAVLHCKTNVPQTLMSLDSVNNLFGRTLNPIKRDVTAGGSSGGEGVLVAMKGSVFGIATDIGGSVRIPAMCNGVYGFKPSKGRIPSNGLENGKAVGTGKEGLETLVGPIARSLNDCGFFCEVVEAADPWERDADVLPGRWWTDGPSLSTEKPIIGVMWRDGLIEPLPPVTKTMAEVVEKLRRIGVEVVEIEAPWFKECQALANAFFGVEGSNHMFGLLEKGQEPLVPWLESRLKRKEAKTLEDLRKLHARKMGMEKDFLRIWRDSRGRKVDAFICPVAPHPVPPIDRWNGVSYTSTFVLLDYPAGIIPVRMLAKEDLYGEMEGAPISSWDKVNRELWEGNTIDRNIYLGTPLSIQVVAPRLQERRLFDAMQIIEHAISRNTEAKL